MRQCNPLLPPQAQLSFIRQRGLVQDQAKLQGGIMSVKSKQSKKRESLQGGMLLDLLLPGPGLRVGWGGGHRFIYA